MHNAKCWNLLTSGHVLLFNQWPFPQIIEWSLKREVLGLIVLSNLGQQAQMKFHGLIQLTKQIKQLKTTRSISNLFCSIYYCITIERGKEYYLISISLAFLHFPSLSLMSIPPAGQVRMEGKLPEFSRSSVCFPT